MVAELRLEMAWSPSYKPSKLESPGRAGPVSVFIPGRALVSGPVPSNIRAGPGCTMVPVWKQPGPGRFLFLIFFRAGPGPVHP